MHVVRFAIAGLISLALALSLVAVGSARAQLVKCEQMAGAPHDGCDCCGDPAACPPSACVAQCFTAQPALAADAVFVPLPHEKLGFELAASLPSLTLAPDPTPSPILIGR